MRLVKTLVHACFIAEVAINTLNKFSPGLLFHWRDRHLTHSVSFHPACCFIGDEGISYTQQVSTQLIVLILFYIKT